MRAFLLLLIVAFGLQGSPAADADLYTNAYVVPPTFLHTENPAPFRDPFAALKPPAERKTAKEVLTNAGITFGQGATAIYNPATSQLIVRNTQDQMELVEAYIDSIRQGVLKQIYVTVKEVSFDNDAKIGKDASAGMQEVFKNIKPPAELTGVLDLPPLVGTTGSNRTTVFDSPDAFRKEFSRPPTIRNGKEEKIGRRINGVLTDPQFQVMIRALNQVEAIDLISLPSVMVRSGQLAMTQADERRFGVQAVLGADEFTVDLQLFLPQHGEPLFEEGDPVTTPYKVTIWDGQTVVIAENREKGKDRFVFVKAQIMDPAGMPIHRKAEKKAEPKEKKPAKSAPKMNITPSLPAEVKKADEMALRGSQLLADGKFSEAVEHYEKALETLPEDKLTVPRRKAYDKQLSRAREEHAKEVYQVGGIESHIVRKGESLFDIAKASGVSVKRVKDGNLLKSEMIKVDQELLVPRKEKGFSDSLRTIIIPKVDFRDVPLDDALGQLLVMIRKHGDRGLFPDFNPKISIEKSEKISNPEITLRLSNVPAVEALRYVTSLAQCRYRVEGEVILIEPLNK